MSALYSYLRKYCLGLAVITVLAFSFPRAHAQVWAGSSGTVDPNSINLVKYIDGRVELRNDAPVGSVAFIRYNVLPVRDLATDLSDIEYRVFAARFLDDGAGHVFLSLKQVNLSTGVITTLMTLTAMGHPPAPLIRKGTRRETPRSTLPGPTLKLSTPLTVFIMWKHSSAAVLPEGRPDWQDFPLRQLFRSC